MQCFSTPPPPLLYTDSYQIFHCVWMKGCSSAVLLNPPPPSSTLIHIRSFTVSEWRDALVQCFSTPPPSSTLIHIRSFTVSEWRDALVQCFSTPPPSSTLILIRSFTVSEWRDALVQCFSIPNFKPIKKVQCPYPTSDYQIISLNIMKKISIYRKTILFCSV